MIKNSNTVYERQNQPEMQALIVAQHFAYTSAKRWVLSLFFILVIIPLGINVALFFNLSDTIIGILSFLIYNFIVRGRNSKKSYRKH